MSEIFSSFEVNRQSRGPLLLGLLAGSIVIHLALAATVLYVPRFRAAFNLAVLAGQTNYVDRAYKKTVVGEDVQMVELSPKFHYPEGYFATDFSATATPTPDPMAPRIISTYQPPKVEPLPSPSPSAAPSASPVPGATNSAVAVTSPAPSTTAAASDNKAEPTPETKTDDADVLGINEGDLNKRPLKDWLARANQMKEKGTIDLTATVEMTVDAKLNSECKLEDPIVVQKSGDHQMIDLAKELAAAIGDSRMLVFLKDPEKIQKDPKDLRCEPMPLRFNVKLDQSDFNATIETEADSPEQAAQRSGVYNWLLVGGAKKKEGRDEEVIFKNTKVTSEGKQIVVHFTMPRQTAGEMLKRQIEAKPAN